MTSIATRVMHVVNNLGKGGLENGLVNLIERMDPLRFEHAVCTVRGLGPHTERLAARGVQIVTLGDGESRFQTPTLIREIRRFRPDVVHSRNWGAIEAVVAGRLTRSCSVIHSEHGFEADSDAGEPKRRTYLRRLAFELADRVLAVSCQLRDVHARRTGFPARKISVIHNGVDRRRFFPDAASRLLVRRELQIGESDLCIGCVANLLPVKSHMTLLNSLPALSDGAGNWRALLIGEGPERPKLQSFVDAHPALKERVIFLGLSSRVPELLRAMDVFVLPSVAEGICNSLLEAMATGLPVVASAVGGNPEVVVDGKSGLLFASRDVTALSEHLSQLRVDPGLRIQLGQGAIERVGDEFSIDSMVQAYQHLYASVRQEAVAASASAVAR